jgi:hypothetical protein
MLICPKFSRILGLLPLLVMIFSCSGQNRFVGQSENHPGFVTPQAKMRIGVLPILSSDWKVLSPCDSCFGLSQNQMEFGFYGGMDSVFRLQDLEVVDSWLLEEGQLDTLSAKEDFPIWLKGANQDLKGEFYQKISSFKSTQIQNQMLEFGLDYIFKPYKVGCEIKGKGQRRGERSCEWRVALFQNKLLPYVAWIGRFKKQQSFFLEGEIDREYHHAFLDWLGHLWEKPGNKDETVELEVFEEAEE